MASSCWSGLMSRPTSRPASGPAYAIISLSLFFKKIQMEQEYNYVTKLDIKFEHFEKIDVNEMVSQCQDKWFNQTLTKVNDSVVRIGIVEGEYHWHKHDTEDEFFFVLD